ncbi:MAG: protein kinase [Candidatus Melainabacteria bacterium]|nr:protein kinase [Candidatus Melainabacteria bacterium]
MVTPSEHCPACLKPKTRASGGFVTQFVDVCRCGDVGYPAPEPVGIAFDCMVCGRLINSRPAGSLTQWVFRPDFCQCETPDPVERSHTSGGADKHVFALEEDDGQELDLGAANFPVDRYQPKVRLGAGASGSVYLSRDRLLGKNVAVKLLHELNAEQLMGFQEEARITSRLHHENIIQVLDFGPTESGIPYMVLEYIEQAEPLQKYLETNGTLDVESWFRIFYKVSDALSHAHDCGVFHRDLKPSNILLANASTDNPQVKLIDFGVAKLKLDSQEPTIVQGRTIAGTPAYMPPELAQGGGFDSRSEIYSLGCVMYESLTGKPPFKGESALEIIAKHTTEPVPPISGVTDREYPYGVELIVSKCLEKDPAKRFSSATFLRNELDRIYVSMSRTEQSAVGVPSEPSVAALEDLQERIAPTPTTTKAPMKMVAPVAGPAPRNSDIKFGAVMALSLLCCVAIVFVMLKGGGGAHLNSVDGKGMPISNDKSKGPKLKPGTFSIDPLTKEWRAEVPLRDDDLIALSNSKIKVERLDVSKGDLEGQLDITDEGWAAVAKLPLKEVNVSRVLIRDSGIKLLSKIPTLKEIDLTDTNVTDKGMEYLVKTPLTHLNVSQCIFISNRSAASIAKISGLKLLNACGTDYTDDSLNQICSSLNLEEIRVNSCTKITSKGLKNLAKCKTLRIVQAQNTKMNADALKAMSGLPLEYLSVAGCRYFDSECMEIIAEQWPGLTHLYIDQNKIDRKCLAELLRFHRLEYLDLASVGLTDKDVDALTKLQNVRCLNLSDNGITDSTVLALRSMKRLKRVTLLKTTHVTKSAVQQLERSGKFVEHFAIIKEGDVNKDLIENLVMPTED